MAVAAAVSISRHHQQPPFPTSGDHIEVDSDGAGPPDPSNLSSLALTDELGVKELCLASVRRYQLDDVITQSRWVVATDLRRVTHDP